MFTRGTQPVAYSLFWGASAEYAMSIETSHAVPNHQLAAKPGHVEGHAAS